jgi:MFS transporter, MHS family, proline/betaine transporter
MSATTDAELSPQQRRTLRRAIGASTIGNATEWYDYSVFALLADTMGRVFFPESSPAAQLLFSYGVLALSFVVRPLGGIVLGPLGDRVGRKRVLAITIFLMAGATFAIGILPSYDTIGVAAPILLIVCRLVQGFSTGGEYGGAATYMAEYSPDNRRGFYGSFLEFGTLSSWVFGLAVVTVCQVAIGDAGMDEWGWRIPFLIAAPLGIVGFYLRWKLEDTPVFLELDEQRQQRSEAAAGARDILAHWRPMLVCAGMVIMLNVTAYTLRTYMPGYLKGPLDLSPNETSLILLVAYIASMIVIIPVGRLSDRVGRKPLWYVSAIGLIVCALPAFALMTKSVGLAIVGLLVLDLLFVLQLATISATFPALFPTHVRYAGFAISYNVATATFGGTAPLVNTALIDATGNTYWPAFYMMAACIVGLVTLRFARETAGASLRGTDVPGAMTAER